MHSVTMKYLSTAILLMALAGCEIKPKPLTTLTSPFDGVDMRLVIKGEDAKVALNTNEKVENLLNDLDAPSAASIKGRINMLLNSPSSKLEGLGGIQSRAGLKSARATLNNPGNFGGPLTTFVVEGQIQDSVWGESGFYYKPGDPMHIWVQMITTATRVAGASTKIERWAEMFRVEVASGAIVEPRNDANPGDVFQAFGSVAFPISAALAKDNQYKLWAVGDDVRVTNYWIDENYDPATGPVYMPSKKYTSTNHPANLANIFAADPDACIDIMFKKNPNLDVDGALDNGELPAGSAPPDYCLGRCKNPPIVNTR